MSCSVSRSVLRPEMKSQDVFINYAAEQYQERVPSLSGGKMYYQAVCHTGRFLRCQEDFAFQEGTHSTQRLVSGTPGSSRLHTEQQSRPTWSQGNTTVTGLEHPADGQFLGSQGPKIRVLSCSWFILYTPPQFPVSFK